MFSVKKACSGSPKDMNAQTSFTIISPSQRKAQRFIPVSHLKKTELQ